MLPGAFKLALLVVLQASDYLDGIRKNILLGGEFRRWGVA
jgi:ADP-ribosylglycohydrolase